MWLVIPLKIVTKGEPADVRYAAVEDTRGRVFVANGDRSQYQPGVAQPGVPRYASVLVELPADAVAGARLRVALDSLDQRRDDMADIDLGLTEVEARPGPPARTSSRCPSPPARRPSRRRGARRDRRRRSATRSTAPAGRAATGGASLALPLALAAALAASSDRVKLYFWDEGLREPQRAAQGDWLDFRHTYTDSEGEHPLEVRVRLDSVAPATTGWNSTTPLELAPGTKAVAVSLSLEADPGLPLAGCKLAVRDAAGTRYEYLTEIGGSQPYSPCVPPDTPGPSPALGEIDKGRDTSGRAGPAGVVEGQPGDHAAGRRRGQRRRPLVGPAELRRALRPLTVRLTLRDAAAAGEHPVDGRGEQAHRHGQPDGAGHRRDVRREREPCVQLARARSACARRG